MEVEVEVQGEDGSKTALGKDEKTVFGRGCGFNTEDRTVSRRHVSFELDHSHSEDANARVSFQVMGKNPFWVYDGEALRLFRKFDKGHLQLGHRFCFSPNTPLWFTLTNIQPLPQLNLDEIHVSEIDPVKGIIASLFPLLICCFRGFISLVNLVACLCCKWRYNTM